MAAAQRPLALVTGASTGLGRALSIELARRGMDLVLVARGEADLAEVAQRCREHEATASILPVDLASPEGPARVEAHVHALGDRLAVLVNNAGVASHGPFIDQRLDQIREIVDLNVRALTELTHRLAPQLVRSRGRLLNVASVAGLQPSPLLLPYAATKAYIIMLSEALRHELGPRGVSVTVLAPSSMRTPFIEKTGMARARAFSLLPVFEPERVAREGVDAMMAGRSLVIPGWLNRVLARLVALLPRRLQAASVAYLLDEP
jgi:short-subunit dehydrogenase